MLSRRRSGGRSSMRSTRAVQKVVLTAAVVGAHGEPGRCCLEDRPRPSRMSAIFCGRQLATRRRSSAKEVARFQFAVGVIDRQMGVEADRADSTFLSSGVPQTWSVVSCSSLPARSR